MDGCLNEQTLLFHLHKEVTFSISTFRPKGENPYGAETQDKKSITPVVGIIRLLLIFLTC